MPCITPVAYKGSYPTQEGIFHDLSLTNHTKSHKILCILCIKLTKCYHHMYEVYSLAIGSTCPWPNVTLGLGPRILAESIYISIQIRNTFGSDYSLECMTIQAWHICICGFAPILLRRSSQALSGWMGRVAAQLFSGLSRDVRSSSNPGSG